MKLITTIKLFTLLVFFTFSFNAFAQEAVLEGIVTDGETREGLIGATIQGQEKGTVTDYDGSFRLPLTAGDVEIKITYVGYETLVQNITLKAGENNLDFSLLEAATILNIATVTSGKFEKPLGEVTVSLEVIKPALLENTNATSVDDILGKVSGVDMIDGQANIRGGSGYSYGAGSRVLLLVDDIPILQPDAGFPNWDDVPVENVEQIEVVKGAASALYGSSAMNGIINIRTGYAKSEPVTKFATFYKIYDKLKDRDKVWWTEKNDSISTPYEFGLSALHKQKFGKFDLVAGGYFLDRKSFLYDVFSKYGRLNVNTRYRFSDRLTAGVNVNFNKSESQDFFYWAGAEGVDALTGNGTALSSTNRTRYNIDPYINFYSKNGIRQQLKGRYYNVNNISETNQSNASQLLYGEYQIQKNFSDINLVATAGLVGIGTSIQAELYGDTIYRINNTAAYLQLDKKFFDKLNISAGFRYERNVLDAPEINVIEGDTIRGGREIEAKPVLRLGANYQVGVATYLRASWGQGYRFPTIAEKYIQTNIGFPIVANPDLTSETGQTFELGIKQGFKIRNWTGFLDIAAFSSKYDNMMEFNLVTIPNVGIAFQSLNVGNTIVKGIDTSIGGQGEIGEVKIGLIGGYTYLDPKYQEFDPAGNDLPSNEIDRDLNPGLFNASTSSDTINFLKYRFKHTFKMDVQAEYKKLSLGAALNYNSYQRAIDKVFEFVIPGVKEYRATNQGGTTLVDVRLAYRFTDNIKLSAIAKNITNIEYTRRPGYLEEPRTYTVRVDFNF